MKGTCLCGVVAYEVQPPFSLFQYCHCSRCRKLSGSAHAANIYVKPEQFKWLEGEAYIGRYEPEETKYFASNFCKKCGSTLPWLVKGGRTLVLPAGTLDDDPEIKPVQNTFWQSRACWYESADSLPSYDELPPRKNKK